MKLKPKLTLSITLLVLLVVLVVTLVYLAGGVREQVREVYDHADFISREVFGQLNQELGAAHQAGQLAPGAEGLHAFLASRSTSPALENLLASAIGNNGSISIRDVALVQPDGTIAVDSNPLLEGQRQPAHRLLGDVLAQRPWSQLGTILGPEQVFAVSLAATVAGQPLGTIAVDVDTVLLRQAVVAKMRELLFYGGLVVLLATVLAWALADLALQPLNAISAQLDALTVRGAGRGPGGGGQDEDAFGRVQSKIALLGQEIADTRQGYSALQANITQVLEGMDEGLLLFDAQGQSVMASAAAPRLLGLAASDLVARPVEALFPSDSRLDRLVRQGVRAKTALATQEAERVAGGRPLLVRLDPVRGGDGQTGALLTVRDAEPVARLENELEVARRLSAVGRLTRGVAHEVKNPLNAMAIHLDLLRAKAGPESEGLQTHIQVIGREIERLDRVVRTFLDFSRPVELKMAAADLSEVARGVADLMREAAAAQGATIALSAPAPGPRVWLDRDLVEQALLNLVNNGLQAMADRGAAPGERTMHLEVFTADRQALVRVRDQGPGIAPEHRERIFDLYFTTRSGGSGIGLALAARILQLHHGAIELEPAVDEAPGASFLLRFPLRARAEVA